MGATAAIGISSVGGAYSAHVNASAQANAIQQQGAFQKNIAEFNTKAAEYQAEDAIERGDKNASDIRKKAEQTIGAQRARMAAQGIDINAGGTTEDLILDTKYMAEIDALQAKTNAMREAFGFKSEALQSTLQGNVAGFASSNAARQTIATGGLQSAQYIATGVNAYFANQKKGT